MTAITIDKDKAIELLEQQVEKKGEDYIYPYAHCVYFADQDEVLDENYEPTDVKCGTPLCILGNVYADLGLTADDLRIYESKADFTGFTGDHEDEDGDKFDWYPGQGGAIGIGDYDVLPDQEKVHLTPEAIAVFKQAQFVQDHRQTWGEAVAKAKEAALDATD